MTRVFNIDIQESGEELKELMSQQTKAQLRDRVRAIYLYQTGQVQTRRELATLLGCNESTLYRWFCRYQSQGLTGLLQVKTSPGKPSKLPADVLEGLRQRLLSADGFQSYGEIQSWLSDEYNIQAAYQTVHGIVRYKLQSKLKVPRPVSTKANPDVQATFKKTPGPGKGDGHLLREGIAHPLFL